jgi:hypothetical protein
MPERIVPAAQLRPQLVESHYSSRGSYMAAWYVQAGEDACPNSLDYSSREHYDAALTLHYVRQMRYPCVYADSVLGRQWAAENAAAANASAGAIRTYRPTREELDPEPVSSQYAKQQDYIAARRQQRRRITGVSGFDPAPLRWRYASQAGYTHAQLLHQLRDRPQPVEVDINSPLASAG